METGIRLSEMHKPTETKDPNQNSLFGVALAPPPKKLRVSYSFPIDSGRTFVPRYKSIPDDSCLYRSQRGTLEVTTGIENWTECFGWERTNVEGICVPAEAFEVICVIREALSVPN